MDQSEELMTLIAASQKPLYTYIRTLLGPSEDVDDILQEVNLVLWRRGHEFDGQGRFLSWACHIAYLKVLGHYRNRRRGALASLDHETLALLAKADYVVNEVERIDARLEALRGCLGKLGPAHWRMLLLRYEDGGSIQRLAERLERPAGSIRVTLHRLRQQLADCIERALRGKESDEEPGPRIRPGPRHPAPGTARRRPDAAGAGGAGEPPA